MDRPLVWLPLLLTAALALWSIMTRKRRKTEDAACRVCLPFWMAVIGMIGGGIFCIPVFAFAKEGLAPILIFSGFTLLGDCLMVAYINCEITYDRAGFTVCSFWGIRRSCRWADVKGVRAGRDHWIYIGKCRYLVDALSSGSERFLAALSRGYRDQTGKDLPMEASFGRKWDPMNGHIEYPWFYFILWIVLALFCVGFTVLAVYCLTVETKPEELTAHTVTFTDYKMDEHGKDLLLYAPGYEKPFRIGYYEDYADPCITPEALCAGETYTAYTQRENGGSIYRLTDGHGADLITMEQERSIYRSRQMPAFILMLIMSPLGVVFSIFGIFITRNPQKYPDWVKKLYYKEGYLQ